MESHASEGKGPPFGAGGEAVQLDMAGLTLYIAPVGNQSPGEGLDSPFPDLPGQVWESWSSPQ